MTAPGPGHEVLRVAERALLVRFLDPDLPTAVARAHALSRLVAAELRPARSQSVQQGIDERHPVKGEEGASAEGEAVPLEVQKAPSERRGPGGATLPKVETMPGRARSSTEGLAWSGECVPGAGNLLVLLSKATSTDETEACRRRLEILIRTMEASEPADARTGVDQEEEEVFRVRYGGEEGPDLEAVARETGLSAERVVELHAGAGYRVAFVGFSPGFAYLLGLPRALEVPRLASPRERVPAGAVAIAGPFAAVYPSATPGGWRLLGRTEARLFDPTAARPARLAPGGRVRFVAAR